MLIYWDTNKDDQIIYMLNETVSENNIVFKWA